MARDKRRQAERNNPKGERQSRLSEGKKTVRNGPHFASSAPSANVLRGVDFLRQGNLAEAAANFQKALQEIPQDALALNCLGIIARTQGNFESAVSFFSQATESRPDFAEAYSNLGNAFCDQNNLPRAAENYEKAIRIKPELAEAHNGLGVARFSQGHLVEAVASYRQAIRLNPSGADAFNNLGNALRDLGHINEALSVFQKALEIAPQSAEIHNNASITLRECGRMPEAIAHGEHSLKLNPQFAEAWSNLGTCRLRLNELETATECFRQAVAVNPQSVSLWTNLYNVLRQQDHTEEANAVALKLAAIEPQNSIHSLRAASLWPVVFPSQAAMSEQVAKTINEWKGLSNSPFNIRFDNLSEAACEPSFNLQFIDDDIRPLKSAYADLFSERLGALFSDWEKKSPSRPKKTSGRGRVGMVVTRGHEGIFAKSLKGVLQRFNQDVAELVVFCPLATLEQMRTELQAPAVTLLPFSERFGNVVAAIQEAACDVLYYWEIGSDSTNYFLPFLRLAPVQCTSWGVQVTSGIPNVDYYLASSLVEVPDAQAHYTEKLLFADSLLTYQYPVAPPALPKSREAFGFSGSQHLYVCAQQLGKFHPQFDTILAEILRHDPHGIVVVTKDRSGHVANLLRQRWEQVIPDVAARIVFLPRLQSAEYLSLIACADVLLDPIHFGGVNSTYDGLALGKPIITLPSKFHRGRYTLGCYNKMDVLDCVAETPDHYVKLCVSLGNDEDFQHHISDKILAGCSRLFEDQQAVVDHEILFCNLLNVAAER